MNLPNNQNKLILLACITLSGCSSDDIVEPGCYIVSRGILTPQQITAVESNEQTATGYERSYDDIFLEKITDEIPIEPGRRFGIIHEFFGIPAGEHIEARLAHPPMTTPDGDTIEKQVFTTYPYTKGTSYGFDNAYEEVPGKWTYEFWFKDELLCVQEFSVVPKEQP